MTSPTLCDSHAWPWPEHEIPYVGPDVKQVITTVVYPAGLPYGHYGRVTRPGGSNPFRGTWME